MNGDVADTSSVSKIGVCCWCRNFCCSSAGMFTNVLHYNSLRRRRSRWCHDFNSERLRRRVGAPSSGFTYSLTPRHDCGESHVYEIAMTGAKMSELCRGQSNSECVQGRTEHRNGKLQKYKTHYTVQSGNVSVPLVSLYIYLWIFTSWKLISWEHIYMFTNRNITQRSVLYSFQFPTRWKSLCRELALMRTFYPTTSPPYASW